MFELLALTALSFKCTKYCSVAEYGIRRYRFVLFTVFYGIYEGSTCLNCVSVCGVIGCFIGVFIMFRMVEFAQIAH